MDRNAKFEAFLSRLESESNKTLIEAVRNGFKALTEGYADVREEYREPVLDSFNRMAINTAVNLGNNVMAFLDRSARKNADLFTVDDEPELDYYDTSEFRQYDYEYEDDGKNEDNNLGLTAGEF